MEDLAKINTAEEGMWDRDTFCNRIRSFKYFKCEEYRYNGTVWTWEEEGHEIISQGHSWPRLKEKQHLQCSLVKLYKLHMFSLNLNLHNHIVYSLKCTKFKYSLNLLLMINIFKT